MLTFRFYDGNENLGELACSSNMMQPSEVSTANCASCDSNFSTGYTEIKVTDARVIAAGVH